MTSLSGFKLSIFVVIFRILWPFVVRHFVFSCLVFVREFVVGLTMSSAPSPITVLCIGHSHSTWLRMYVEAAEWFAVGWRVYFCSNFVTHSPWTHALPGRSVVVVSDDLGHIAFWYGFVCARNTCYAWFCSIYILWLSYGCALCNFFIIGNNFIFLILLNNSFQFLTSRSIILESRLILNLYLVYC